VSVQFFYLCASSIKVGVGSLDLSPEAPKLRFRVFDLGLRVATRGVDLLLRLRPQLFESGSKRANLYLRGTFQFFPMFLCRCTNLRELPFRFLAGLGRDLLRGGGNGSLLILCGHAQELLSKIVQFRFEMLTQAGRRTVNRRADPIVERH
jgi:hypothetical protein